MGAHVAAPLRIKWGFKYMSKEIEKATIVAYIKQDEDTGTDLIINLFETDGKRWVGLSVSQDDSRKAIMMPYAQWQEMVKDMESR